MGLLNRALTLEDGTDTGTAADPTDVAGNILAEFTYTTDHVDYPGGVFKAFRELLEFSRGSLLLADRSSGVYFPWISCGFDRTTSRRMRIPMDFKTLGFGESGCLTPLIPQDFETMFSNREFGLINSLDMITLGPEETPSALLMIADCRWSGSIPDSIQTAVRLLSRHLGSGIEHSRRLTMEPEEEDFADLSEWLESWGDRNGVLASIDLRNMIELYTSVVAGVEPFYARCDSVNLVRRITGRMGRFHDLKDGRILIMFPPDRLPDRQLFLHQLAVSVRSAFLELSETPAFQAEFRNWPEEKAVVKEHLSGFF